MTKEAISKHYIDYQKDKHDWKKTPDQRVIAITGAGKEGSIGATIADSITNSITDSLSIPVYVFNQDIEADEFDFENCTDLIMCHGYTYMDWIENVPNIETRSIINVNLIGSIRVLTKFVNDTMEAPHRKKIISIGSMAYRNVLNGSAAYCASKAGLNMFIRCAAWELAPKGYDVYIIHPSNVENTPMTKDTIAGLMRYRKLSIAEALDYWSANNPRESFLTKEEIAQHVNYLLFDNTSYLSGCPIELAGGQR
jgi:NAD(P)-dependent dehydrogenase (short-subunit alcohol dehydrogenase family)